MKDNACGNQKEQEKTASQTLVCSINYRLCADVLAEGKQVKFQSSDYT